MQKKLISVLLATFMLATCLLSLTACNTREATQQSVAATPAAVGLQHKVGASYIMYGDVNGDKSIDMKDVVLVRKIIVGSIAADSTEVDVVAADCNGDESTDMKDVLLLRQYIAHFPVTMASGTRATTATTAAPTTTTAPTTTAPTTTPTTYINQEDPAINFIKGTDKSMGVWWWQMVSSNLETSYLDLLEKNQFTEIYYYAYDMIPSQSGRQQIHTFVQKAKERGMRVSILFDDVSVAQRSNFFAWENMINGFVQYRSEYPEDTTLYGVHCDIEPRASSANLQNYVTYFISEVVEARQKGIAVEVDLNCGWESWGRNLTFNGVQGIYQIVAANVDTMCLMSYSDTAAAIYGMSYYPMEAAKAAGTKLVFGIELGNSGEGNKVDFHDESKYDAYLQLYLLDARIANQEWTIPYGYAIHHMKAYYSLRATMPTTAAA